LVAEGYLMGEDCWWDFCMIRRFENDIEIMAAHMTARESRKQKPYAYEAIAYSMAKTSESSKLSEWSTYRA